MVRNLARRGRRWLMATAAFALSLTTARAQQSYSAYPTGVSVSGSCASCNTCETRHCQSHHCPPHLAHCMEGAPRIHVRIGCPRPICNPCSQPGWGYYETCWNPWPWPPNYGHCPTVPPAALVALSGPMSQNYPFYAPNDSGVPNGAQNYAPSRPSNGPLVPPGTVTPAPTPSHMAPITPGMPPSGANQARPTPVPLVVPANPNNPLESLPVPRGDQPLPRFNPDGF